MTVTIRLTSPVCHVCVGWGLPHLQYRKKFKVTTKCRISRSSTRNREESMNINKFHYRRQTLYAFLFCISATLSMCFFLFLIIVTSFVLWIMVPSILIYGFSFSVFLVLFACIFLLALHRKRHGLMAASLGAMSAPVLLLALALTGAVVRTKPEQPANRQQPSTSPSGKYVLTVPIEREDRPGLFEFGSPYWHVTISDPNGNVLYRDAGKDFPGWFGAYWVWDHQDRVWIFSYDSGTVFFECVDGIWTRHQWWSENKKYKQRGISPPIFFIQNVKPNATRNVRSR